MDNLLRGCNRYFYPRSPRGERLWYHNYRYRHISYFYPRSPRGERHHLTVRDFSNLRFLPALPARGATCSWCMEGIGREISTRAPREGSDFRGLCQIVYSALFLPALPARGATTVDYRGRAKRAISTRAPREGSDHPGSSRIPTGGNFYPRSPRGERLHGYTNIGMPQYFYPRSPRGERP